MQVIYSTKSYVFICTIVLLNLLYNTSCASRNRSRNHNRQQKPKGFGPVSMSFWSLRLLFFHIWLSALASKRWITLVFSQHITTDLVLRFCSWQLTDTGPDADSAMSHRQLIYDSCLSWFDGFVQFVIVCVDDKLFNLLARLLRWKDKYSMFFSLQHESIRQIQHAQAVFFQDL